MRKNEILLREKIADTRQYELIGVIFLVLGIVLLIMAAGLWSLTDTEVKLEELGGEWIPQRYIVRPYDEVAKSLGTLGAVIAFIGGLTANYYHEKKQQYLAQLETETR